MFRKSIEIYIAQWKMLFAACFMMVLAAAAQPHQISKAKVIIDLSNPKSYKSSTKAKTKKSKLRYKDYVGGQEKTWSPDPAKKRYSPSFLHRRAELWLAAVLFGECRDQEITCMQMVGNVAMNRAKLNLDKRYGRGLWGVLKKKYAFSCLLDSDPNSKVIKKAMAGKLKLHSPDEIKWSVAVGVAHQLMHRGIPDATKGSTLYHAPYANPKWNKPKYSKKMATGGGHIFYKEKLN